MKSNRKGFAAVLAIALFGIVGMAVVAAMTLFATEVRRSRAESADAQIRQLLIAGTTMAPQTLQNWNGEKEQMFFLVVPRQLEQDGARLSLTARPSDTGVVVLVDAMLGRRHGWQTLSFTRTSGGLKLTGATLNG